MNDVVVMEIGYSQTDLLGVGTDDWLFEWTKLTQNVVQAATWRERRGDELLVNLMTTPSPPPPTHTLTHTMHTITAILIPALHPHLPSTLQRC